MAAAKVETGIHALQLARRSTLGLIEEIPEDKLCTQVWEGGNHPKWVLGHLAWTDDYFMTTIGKLPSRLPDGWWDRFQMGSKPSANAADYPSLSELQDVLSETREALISWLGGLSAQQAAVDLGEELKTFSPTIGDLAASMAWHEGLHAGQISAVRRSLGFGPKMG
jgi:hypothetical protein